MNRRPNWRSVDDRFDHGPRRIPASTIHFTTWTLRYNQMLWVTIDSLGHHWERARVDADIVGKNEVKVKTENVRGLTLAMEPGMCPLDMLKYPLVTLDGQSLVAPSVGSDRSWTVHFPTEGDCRAVGGSPVPGELAKRHGLQGPIDDSFLARFHLVRTSGSR